jgi:ubiquinone biosynthesis protein COQ9
LETSDAAAAEYCDLRDSIVQGALIHAAFDGWTMKALAAGAADAGLTSDDAARAFPNGVVQAAEHLSDWADRLMLARLALQDVDSMRMRDRIILGVRARLEVLAANREGARWVLGFTALPAHAGLASRCVYRTVDAIWHAAGDRSADFSFYTKRGLLAAVYGSTVLYWLADDSENSADTWTFLDRRIADVMRIPGIKERLWKPFAQMARAAGNLCGGQSSRRSS